MSNLSRPDVTIITASQGKRNQFLLDASRSIIRARETGMSIQWILVSPATPPIPGVAEWISIDYPLTPSQARMIGLERACGRFVVNLDDDDILGEDFNAQLFATLDEKRVYAAKSCDWFPRDNFFKVWDGQLSSGDYEAGDVSALAQSYPVAIHPSTLIVPLKILRESGGWDVSLSEAEDIDLAFRLMKMRGMTMLDAVTHCYRKHPKQMTRGAVVQERDPEIIRDVYTRYGICPDI